MHDLREELHNYEMESSNMKMGSWMGKKLGEDDNGKQELMDQR